MDHLYLILDSSCIPLAQAVLESPLEAEVLQLRVLDDAVSRVAAHKEIQLVGLDDRTPARAGVITHVKGDQLVVRPTAFLGPDARENLRIATDFHSVIYPITGSWKGQHKVAGKDLSCGGVAFHCDLPLKRGEIAELILPMTDSPLVLRIQILHPLPTTSSTPLYSAKFVNLIQDEEFLIRKAVFSIQLSNA